MPQNVDFFFDFVSPYTYLAHSQLPALKQRTGATFRLWPIHLINLMKQVGNVPTTVICSNKMKYASQDIARWLAKYKVPFQTNPHVFSGDPSLALRGALVAEKQGMEVAYAKAMFGAYWKDAADVNDRSCLEATLDAAGLSGKKLLDAADQPEYGDLLEKNTKLAAERGVFGAPTFIVGDDIYFGNDRLEFLEQRLLG